MFSFIFFNKILHICFAFKAIFDFVAWAPECLLVWLTECLSAWTTEFLSARETVFLNAWMPELPPDWDDCFVILALPPPGPIGQSSPSSSSCSYRVIKSICLIIVIGLREQLYLIWRPRYWVLSNIILGSNYFLTGPREGSQEVRCSMGVKKKAHNWSMCAPTCSLCARPLVVCLHPWANATFILCSRQLRALRKPT